MCKQHWERIMELIHHKQLPKNVNLMELRAYVFACFLECKITRQEMHQFETGVQEIEPSVPRLV